MSVVTGLAQMNRCNTNIPAVALAGAVLILLGFGHRAQADSFPNSLWIGTDDNSSLHVFNVDRSGVLLRDAGAGGSVGFAIDLDANTIYFGNGGATSGNLTPRNLDTLAAGSSVSLTPSISWEDMTFDGSRIWRANAFTPDRGIYRINPSSGAVEFSFDPGFNPVGVAWDGSDLWVSEFTTGGKVAKFTTAGVEVPGTAFNPVLGGGQVGGLAFDTTDNTLWIGTFTNVYHYTTGGTELGHFAVAVADGRFVDGLEFQGVPEPASLTLLGSGLLGWLALKRRRRQ